MHGENSAENKVSPLSLTVWRLSFFSSLCTFPHCATAPQAQIPSFQIYIKAFYGQQIS